MLIAREIPIFCAMPIVSSWTPTPKWDPKMTRFGAIQDSMVKNNGEHEIWEGRGGEIFWVPEIL